MLKADQHIAEEEARLTRQVLLVEQIRKDGRNTQDTEPILTSFRDSLQLWHDHRDEILRVIARFEIAAAAATNKVSDENHPTVRIGKLLQREDMTLGQGPSSKFWDRRFCVPKLTWTYFDQCIDTQA